jgi:hypothetical protein
MAVLRLCLSCRQALLEQEPSDSPTPTSRDGIAELKVHSSWQMHRGNTRYNRSRMTEVVTADVNFATA